LIAAYIPAGTVVGLIAAGGTGKTLLTYDLVKAIAVDELAEMLAGFNQYKGDKGN